MTTKTLLEMRRLYDQKLPDAKIAKAVGVSMDIGKAVMANLPEEVEHKLIDIEWRNADYELPADDEFVLALVSGKPKANIELVDAACIASYYDSDGWIIEEYPEWENPTVKWWMPIPEPPEVCE